MYFLPISYFQVSSRNPTSNIFAIDINKKSDFQYLCNRYQQEVRLSLQSTSNILTVWINIKPSFFHISVYSQYQPLFHLSNFLFKNIYFNRYQTFFEYLFKSLPNNSYHINSFNQFYKYLPGKALLSRLHVMIIIAKMFHVKQNR